jgi:hypothetical protein
MLVERAGKFREAHEPNLRVINHRRRRLFIRRYRRGQISVPSVVRFALREFA